VKSTHTTGVALVVLSALVFSTAGLFTKGVAVDAWTIIFWRGLSAAGFTIVFIIWRRTLRNEASQLGFPAFLATVFMASGTAAFIPAFKMTSIANVSMIWAAAPFVTALLAWTALRERPEKRVIIASLIAIAGVAIVLGGSVGGGNLTGDLLALWMTLMMAAAIVVYRVWPDTPAALPAALSSLVLLPVSFLVTEPMQIPISEFYILIAFGLIFAIASVTLLEGVRRIPAAEGALLGALETPLAPIWAFILFTELPATATFIGGAIILAAIVWSQLSAFKS